MFAFDLALAVAVIPFLHVLMQVFVEFENATQRRSWVKVYDERVKAVMVEDSIVWISRSDRPGATGASGSATPCPALVSGITQDGLEFLTVLPVSFQS